MTELEKLNKAGKINSDDRNRLSDIAQCGILDEELSVMSFRNARKIYFGDKGSIFSHQKNQKISSDSPLMQYVTEELKELAAPLYWNLTVSHSENDQLAILSLWTDSRQYDPANKKKTLFVESFHEHLK